MLNIVVPIMEFASICWDPVHKNLKNNLEKVQKTAAKFVTNFYPKKDSPRYVSVTEMVKKLGWETLEKRRKNAKLTMAYKILNDKVILEPDCLPKKEGIHKIRKRNDHHLKIPFSKIDEAKKTFFYDVPQLWNSLISEKQARALNTDAFKRKL